MYVRSSIPRECTMENFMVVCTHTFIHAHTHNSHTRTPTQTHTQISPTQSVTVRMAREAQIKTKIKHLYNKAL